MRNTLHVHPITLLHENYINIISQDVDERNLIPIPGFTPTLPHDIISITPNLIDTSDTSLDTFTINEFSEDDANIVLEPMKRGKN